MGKQTAFEEGIKKLVFGDTEYYADNEDYKRVTAKNEETLELKL